jgi:type VI secretion system FHA domain protein
MRPSSFDVDEFLRAAGLDPAAVSPETAASLGQILRTVIQGVVEVLHARAQVKDQFRLAATRVMTKENNPLKFSVNAESALSFLLGHRDPAYLAPVEAFEDAMNDIRFHQLAMLSGMRAGFDHMMKHFDPSQLQQLFEKRAKRGGLLAMGAKSRYWEQYTEEFGELAGDPEAAFRRVFGEAFASGYEKQLNTLKASHGKLQR